MGYNQSMPSSRTTSPVISDNVQAQWRDALALARASLCANPPPEYDYNEHQQPWNGKKTGASGAIIWTGNTKDSQLRSETRSQFIRSRKAEGHKCCAHGAGFQSLGGEITTAEYVPFYNLCPCCSSVLKRDDDDGADQKKALLRKLAKQPRQRRSNLDERTGFQSVYCRLCRDDRLIVDDTSEAGAEAILRADGWQPISYEDAEKILIARWQPSAIHGRDYDWPVTHRHVFTYGNCTQEIREARNMIARGEDVQLWTNPVRAQEELEDHHDSQLKYIESTRAAGNEKYAKMLEDRLAAEPYTEAAMIFETETALNWIADDRLEALEST